MDRRQTLPARMKQTTAAALSVPVPSTVAPFLKVTIPVGVPAPGLLTLTAAVKVTGDDIQLQILSVFPGFILQQIHNCLAVRQAAWHVGHQSVQTGEASRNMVVGLTRLWLTGAGQRQSWRYLLIGWEGMPWLR